MDKMKQYCSLEINSLIEENGYNLEKVSLLIKEFLGCPLANYTGEIWKLYSLKLFINSHIHLLRKYSTKTTNIPINIDLLSNSTSISYCLSFLKNTKPYYAELTNSFNSLDLNVIRDLYKNTISNSTIIRWENQLLSHKSISILEDKSVILYAYKYDKMVTINTQLVEDLYKIDLNTLKLYIILEYLNDRDIYTTTRELCSLMGWKYNSRKLLKKSLDILIEGKIIKLEKINLLGKKSLHIELL